MHRIAASLKTRNESCRAQPAGETMITEAKHDRALEAINAVLVHARAMAASRVPYEDLVEVLDALEYLPTLFLRHDDQTDQFRAVLADNAQKFPGFQTALERFDRDA
jgi:hypothetical protein